MSVEPNDDGVVELPAPLGVARDQLPCGCVVEVDAHTEEFRMKPCSLTCEYFLYAMKESVRQGKSIEARLVDG